MPRDERAYLADVVESCTAIEAVAALFRAAPAVFGTIPNARRIIDFRNQLTHEYPTVDDALVWAIIEKDVPRLKETCGQLLENADREQTT
jgi:uncharacterized protein with HEPN domain